MVTTVSAIYRYPVKGLSAEKMDRVVAAVPAGTIEDHHGMGIGGDLAADLAEMMVHRGGIADRHDQRRRFALRPSHRFAGTQ
jgi:hypothetical protein